MRAFTGGYYRNLIAMYQYLNVRYAVQQFLWVFSKPESDTWKFELDTKGDEEKKLMSEKREKSSKSASVVHFIHASYGHQLPPIIPASKILIEAITDILYIAFCYLWYSFCCLVVHPRTGKTEGLSETWGEYLHYIGLPKTFRDEYLVPMIASVATCSHREILGFPASDVIQYKSRTTFRRHYTVLDGMDKVQGKLMEGLNIRLSSQVISVTPLDDGKTQVTWQSSLDGVVAIQHKTFDKVILAVPPSVVGAIFEKAQPLMKLLPSVSIENIVHFDDDATRDHTSSIRRQQLGALATSGRHLSRQAHIIYLNQRKNLQNSGPFETEVSHVYPGGAISTTCPISPIDPAKVVQRSKFTRVLRTPESRKIVNGIFGTASEMVIDGSKRSSSWRNGSDGVWLVGGWCWDGMVLLEGCIVSAVRVAREFDVEVPW